MRPIASAVTQDPKDPKRRVCETMLVWGKVTRDAKFEYTKGATPKPKVTFGIAYEDKRFMNVISVGDCRQTELAQRAQKGDWVLIAGHWASKEYRNSAGEDKTWDELRIDHMEILSDGVREAALDALVGSLNAAMADGYIQNRKEFTKKFNAAFVDSFWELCQQMQGPMPEEDVPAGEYEDVLGTDDYELTI